MVNTNFRRNQVFLHIKLLLLLLSTFGQMTANLIEEELKTNQKTLVQT